MKRHSTRTGAALLEVLVASVLLGVAIATLAALAAQSTASVAMTMRTEEELERESEFMEAVALWDRGTLDQRLGSRRQGIWRLIIQRAAPDLYELTLTDSTGTRDLLHTAVFREMAAADAP